MPLPTKETLHKYADGVLVLLDNLDRLGDAAKAAFQEFHDRFFDKHDLVDTTDPNAQPMRSSGAAPLSADALGVVAEALEASDGQS